MSDSKVFGSTWYVAAFLNAKIIFGYQKKQTRSQLPFSLHHSEMLTCIHFWKAAVLTTQWNRRIILLREQDHKNYKSFNNLFPRTGPVTLPDTFWLLFQSLFKKENIQECMQGVLVTFRDHGALKNQTSGLPGVELWWTGTLAGTKPLTAAFLLPSSGRK